VLRKFYFTISTALYLEDGIIVVLCQEKKINSRSSGVELELPYLHSAELRESRN
jgi:hypothetical protein